MASAQDRTTASSEQTVEDDDLHNRRVDTSGVIVVTAPGVDELDVLAGSTVVEGRELQRELDGQIGEVLAKQPGVSATSFSPGASRPVLRGFDGERVRVLIDGIGAIDASNTSADHAVTVDPLTTERVEILRGPAVLLYGSQAIGGAVNIIDKRIPLRRLNEPFHVDVLAEADTARNLLSGAGSLDVPLGDMFVFHVDGSYRNTDDIEIPGFSVSDALRADLLADAAEEEEEGEFEEADELREAANQEGILPNSYTETWSANTGLTLFAGDSNLGFSFGVYDTLYGVPGRPGAGHHHGEEEGAEEEAGEEEGEERVSIDLRQYRADLRGELDLGDGFFSMLRTRVGYSDYTHTEFEGEEVGTVFDVQGIEARAELVQNTMGNLGGSIGVQYYFRDFEAIGAEAFVQPNRTDQFSVFALQELDLGGVQLEGAARYETVDVDSRTLGIRRDFDLFSGAASLVFEPSGEDGIRFGVTGSRAERAPSGEELFSNGPHIATQQFEIGDPDLQTESAWGAEAFVRGRIGPASLSLSVFKNWFDNYIYLQDTGAEEDDLPVYQFLQADADYFGIEGQITMPLVEQDGFTLLADLRGDYVEAELDDGTNVPRIPPLSLLGALEAQTGPVDARVEVQYFAEQDEIAPFETTTDEFTFVNASLAFTPIRGDNTVRILLKADNIFDVEGRRHSSFTKDFVPLPGRNFKVSVLTSF
ncbi:TonB-dependent receptor [Qipengyuania sp. JC766]|uniref:TonB-dependent receptor n=1 Tax=Qipengyuania sp. JC766 TaxID=3232139 RepID=UPI0034599E7C